MITYEEAIELILANAAYENSKEYTPLTQCFNRILAEDIYSDINMPPFDKSAVDGYACRLTDLPGPLRVLETVSAGALPVYEITKGCCSKIMTGAKVPTGADIVIMIEDTEETDKQTIKFTGDNTSRNICYMSEDIKEGDLVVSKGTLIKAWHIGIMATVGITRVPVSCMVSIGIITTGDELLEPGQPLVEGKIRNSNAWQLIGSCYSVGSIPTYYGIVGDELQATVQILEKAISENDIVLITGGVSVGEFDFVSHALKKTKLEIKFHSIAMQPGRPLVYARDGKKHCFGLPGNPVSTLIQFELSVKPLIYKLMGHNYQPVIIPMKIADNIKRKKSSRKSLYPVKLRTDYKVSPLKYHGSAHINAFADAFGLIEVEQGITEIKKGEVINVRLL